MATFSDYYKAMAAAGPQQRPSAPPQYDLSGLQPLVQKVEDRSPQSPLEWAIDILSRPLYGVTNAVTGVSEGIAGSRESGNPLAAAGGIAAAPTNFLSGFFNTSLSDPNADMQRTFSDVLEEQTDRHGKINDPNYEDTENNVNPVAKGIVGFGLDVVADPLMYIPGGALLKAGKGAVKGGKAVVEGGEKVLDAVRGGKTADDAVPAARIAEEENPFLTGSDSVPSPPARQSATPVESEAIITPGKVEQWARTAPLPEARKLWNDYESALKKLGSVDVAKGTFLSNKVPELEAKLTKLYRKHNPEPAPRLEAPARYSNEADRTFTAGFRRAQAAEGAGVKAELDTILKLASGGAPTAAKPVQSMGDWVGSNLNRMIEPDDLDLVIDSIPNVPVKTREAVDELLLSTSGNGAPYTYRRLDDIARNGSGDIAKLARIMMNRLYKQASPEDAKLNITDALSAFNIRRSQDEDAVRSVFGDALFEHLERQADAGNAKKFDKVLRDIGRLADPASDISVLDKVGAQTRDAFVTSMGLPPYIRPEPGSADDVARISDQIHSAQSPADEALLRTLGAETPAGEAFKQKYTHREGNVAFTEADKEVRFGRHVRQLNSMFQYQLNKNAFAAIAKRMEATTGRGLNQLAGIQRAKAYRSSFYDTWDSMSRSLDGLGVQLKIGVGKEQMVNLSFRDIVELTERNMDSNAALAGLFNGGTQIPPTLLMQAAHTVVTTGLRGEDAVNAVRQILGEKLVRGVRGRDGKPLPNNAAKSGYAAHFPLNQEKSARAFANEIHGAKVVKNPNGGWYVKTGKEGMVEPLARAVAAAADGLAARAAENSAAYAARGLKETRSLTTTQLNRIQRVLQAGSMSDQVASLAKLRQGVAEAGGEIGAYPSSVAAAGDVLETAVGDFAATRARLLQRAGDDVAAARTTRKQAVATAATKVSESTGREADEILKAGGFDEPVEMVEDAGSAAAQVAVKNQAEKYDLGVMDPNYGLAELAGREGYTSGILHGLRRTFDQRYGMKNIFDIFHARRTVAGQFLAETTQQLRALRNFDNTQLLAAIKAVQTGSRNVDPAIAEATAGVERVLSQVFDTGTGTKNVLNSPLLRAEPNVDHINSVLQQKFGYNKEIPFQFNEVDDFAEMANQWRSWEFKDPLSDLYRISDALATVAEHRGIVGNFLYSMGKAGLVSNAYKPGFVKIVNSGGSRFADLIPEGTFVQREVARELHNLDIMVRTDRKFSGDLGKFVQGSFIPAQNIWKQAVTVYRPGHHVRNELSNDFMSWIARGNSYWLRSQKDAMRVLGMKNEYQGANLVESLTAIGERAPVGNDVIVAGSRYSFTADEIAKLFQDHGLKTTFNVSEDLMQDVASGRLARVGEQMTNSKLGQVAGGVSHLVDHKGKLQHFIQILHQEATGKGRWGKLSKDELVRRAVQEVKRSHPDSLMLTPTEAKWRFLIPFYTWFAKTLPFAMESAARNPGRLMAIPKASYALAESMGLNPNTLSDPFPDDQLFPSFVTDGAFGPQFEIDGKYVNINPGVPQFDMLEQIFSPNPVQGVLGMTSPLLRVPAELATGSQIGGRKINDTSDYIDQNIPIINYLANMTGTSVTGSVASTLQGKGLDPQLQVARGNKDEFDQMLSMFNWLSGLNAQNWSRPNFVNYAEIEKRNAASGNDRSGF